ncbi:MAG: quinone-dependent dihydroorotate dehydrogenase [Candidatus Symbiobacter sp.]|nr:quinone-dependent dihydroorotate dehydrogenase [Candidatus Symbiobacter sp.]
MTLLAHFYPLLHLLPPELARDLTLKALAWGVAPAPRLDPPDPALSLRQFGHELRSPIGLAAGFDKSGQVYHRMANYGFAFTEIGSITPKPRRGNKKPRLFRLAEDQAMINRMGFNNDGMAVVAARLSRLARLSRSRRENRQLLGINLTSDPDSPNLAASIQDFIDLLTVFYPLADYIVLDISCPNTANGQQFLQPDALAALLTAIAAFRAAQKPGANPILAKLSPDINDKNLAAIMAVIMQFNLTGLVVANSTTRRDQHLKSRYQGERGGLTGRPLMAASTQLLAELYQDYGQNLTFIGVGGIFSAYDIVAKILAGASLVQVYTGFTFNGPDFIRTLERDLRRILAAHQIPQVSDLIGQSRHQVELYNLARDQKSQH